MGRLLSEVRRFQKIAGLTEDLDLSDTPEFQDDFRSLFYPYLKLYGVEDDEFYSVVQVGYYGEEVLAEKVKGKDICRVYEEAVDDQFGIEYLQDMVEGMFTDEEFPEACVRDGIEGIVSLVLGQDDVLDIRPVSLKEDDLDLSNTPKFNPKRKKIVFPNGLRFIEGGLDPEGGIVVNIIKYKKGYLIMGQEYDWNAGMGWDDDSGEIDSEALGEEGYGYYYDLEGNHVEEGDVINESDDLDLSDTPKFSSMLTPEDVRKDPSFIPFADDSDWGYNRFGFAEIKGQVYYIPDLEYTDYDDMEVVQLKKGISLRELIYIGEEKGFFEVNEFGHFYNMDLEIEINDWLNSLTA